MLVQTPDLKVFYVFGTDDRRVHFAFECDALGGGRYAIRNATRHVLIPAVCVEVWGDVAYSHELLVDNMTGAFDLPYLKAQARRRATSRYGAGNVTVLDLRREISELRDIAFIMQARAREALGLPDLTVYVANASLQRDLEQYGAE